MIDYENRYKEALERAKSAIKECGDNVGRIKMIESIFPELAESEDERMLKELILGFYAYKELYPNFWKLRTDEIIEWLKRKKDEHTTDNRRFPFGPQELRELHTQGRCVSEERKEASERLCDEPRD